jgi:hypothetical protein
MQAPHIQSALPLRRYEVGDFSGVVLGEIRSDDPHHYHYILALVPFGGASPLLYVIAQRAEDLPQDPRTIVRVVAETGERAFGPDDRWLDLDAFCEDALGMARAVLGLTAEEPRRLL